MSYTYNNQRRLTPAAGSLCLIKSYLVPFTVFRGDSFVVIIIYIKTHIVNTNMPVAVKLNRSIEVFVPDDCKGSVARKK